jgi:phage gp16-like protein
LAYRIKPYSYQQAKKIGVTIKPSAAKGKKIDVFNRKGEKVASIGALGMGDYPTFKTTVGAEFAEKRRKAYKSRHEKNRHKRGSAGYYADKILW